MNPEFPTRTIGVVEKCTFCYERLAKRAKTCMRGRINGALVFGDLEIPASEIRKFSLRNIPSGANRNSEQSRTSTIY